MGAATALEIIPLPTPAAAAGLPLTAVTLTAAMVPPATADTIAAAGTHGRPTRRWFQLYQLTIKNEILLREHEDDIWWLHEERHLCRLHAHDDIQANRWTLKQITIVFQNIPSGATSTSLYLSLPLSFSLSLSLLPKPRWC